MFSVRHKRQFRYLSQSQFTVADKCGAYRETASPSVRAVAWNLLSEIQTLPLVQKETDVDFRNRRFARKGRGFREQFAVFINEMAARIYGVGSTFSRARFGAEIGADISDRLRRQNRLSDFASICRFALRGQVDDNACARL